MSGRLASAACIVLLSSLGCQSWNTSPTEDFRPYAKNEKREPEKAAKLQSKAARLLQEGRYDEAEQELKVALAADLFNGEAHNNLGTIHFERKRYYQAAWEFQYAAKLMPNKAEPLNNIGMVMEEVGKLDDAAEYYEKAVTLEPDNIVATGNLARTYVRAGRRDKRTREVLSEVVLKASRPEWALWAKERLTSMGDPDDLNAPINDERK
jgi:Flp pilus assembly protein TadD